STGWGRPRAERRAARSPDGGQPAPARIDPRESRRTRRCRSGSRSSRGGERAAEILEADVALERPRRREHGDWASNVALRLGKRLGRDSRELAEALAEELNSLEGIAHAESAGPGFLNITLDAAAAGVIATRILE